MAWGFTGGKPLPLTMLTQFTDAYLRHEGEMSLNEKHHSLRYLTWTCSQCWCETYHNSIQQPHVIAFQLHTFSVCLLKGLGGGGSGLGSWAGMGLIDYNGMDCELFFPLDFASIVPICMYHVVIGCEQYSRYITGCEQYSRYITLFSMTNLPCCHKTYIALIRFTTKSV